MKLITIHTRHNIQCVNEAGYSDEKYERCSKKEATIKLTLKGRPADNKLRQRTHYLREVKICINPKAEGKA